MARNPAGRKGIGIQSRVSNKRNIAFKMLAQNKYSEEEIIFLTEVSQKELDAIKAEIDRARRK